MLNHFGWYVNIPFTKLAAYRSLVNCQYSFSFLLSLSLSLSKCYSFASWNANNLLAVLFAFRSAVIYFAIFDYFFSFRPSLSLSIFNGTPINSFKTRFMWSILVRLTVINLAFQWIYTTYSHKFNLIRYEHWIRFDIEYILK